MKRRLREELIKLSTDIITSREDKELTELYETAKAMYEKLAVLKFIDENLNHLEVDVSKSVIASKFENMANAVMNGNRSVPESNPHVEDIVTPGMDTIKDMISEMPQGAVEDILNEFLAKPEPVKNDKDYFSPLPTPGNIAPQQRSLNDSLAKEIQIGLNDRLAFVKNLFDNDMQRYLHVLRELNGIDSEERSVSYINNMVKPEYNSWVGKEEYETRFMSYIQRRFA